MKHYNALYIEKGAKEYAHGRRLLSLFRDHPVIELDHYGEFFHRPGQDFQAQKAAPALIAAVASPPFLYEATERVAGASETPVFYTDQLRNCVYNCEYCFLQGMHASGHSLVFVNTSDFHRAAERQATMRETWLSISYLSDILAFEEILPLVSEWISFSKDHPDVTVEVRTKGEASRLVRSAAASRFVLVWSLSPPLIASRHERGCASFQNRLFAMETAIRNGWRVRIAVDPVLLVPGWREAYGQMIHTLFHRIPPEKIESATYGVFRMGSDFMGRITPQRRDSALLHHPFRRDGGLVTYREEEIQAVHEAVGRLLRDRLGDEKVVFIHG